MSVADAVFRHWLERLDRAFAAADADGVADAFVEDGYWRDILAFGWEFRTYAGRPAIAAAFETAQPEVQPTATRVAEQRIAPRLLKRAGEPVIEAFFDFDTTVGRASAFVRLRYDERDPDATRAFLLLTTLQELHGFEERVGERRPSGVEWSQNFAGENWLDLRVKAQEFGDRSPEVLIVGAGQAGLALAARLGAIGVDALIVERHPRVGDNWRRRYHSLTLHNEIWANSLPYLPYPPNWPTFLPKDKLAGWLEAYAEFMELNVWTDTELVSADYDEARGSWTAQLRRGDGRSAELQTAHLVLASGSVSGLPHMPSLPLIEDFRGEVVHSSRFASGIPYAGQRAVVFGTGNSGHDVAQELHANGAQAVTMVQRGPTCVVSLVPSGVMVYALYTEGPVDDMDLITASIPYPVLESTYQWMTRKTCELDRELLERLTAAGFELDFEPDRTGFHMKYLRRAGGYYINVGCSELIADGSIGLVQARDIERFTAEGLRLRDGRLIPCDLVVLATGFENQRETVRRVLGEEVAERVGPIWGFDGEGFLANMWMRTGQEGLWIAGGGLNECRLFSRFLALQIKADLEGLTPASARRRVAAA